MGPMEIRDAVEKLNSELIEQGILASVSSEGDSIIVRAIGKTNHDSAYWFLCRNVHYAETYDGFKLHILMVEHSHKIVFPRRPGW